MPSAIEPLKGFTFGCDPELFVQNELTGKFVSAAGLIPGTKEEPFPVPGGAIQVDGAAAEYNIDPVDNFKDFVMKNKQVKAELQKRLPQYHKLVAVPSVVFDEDVWDKMDEASKTLGCSPDYNAWTGEVNDAPERPHERMACAGGHIHIGWTEDAPLADLQHITNCRDLVKQLDWYLASWALSVDQDSERRKMYGKAGACRIKPYGVEYRALSNFWVEKDSTFLATWNRLQQAIKDMRRNFMPDTGAKWKLNDKLIQSINTSKRDTSLEQHFRFPIRSISSY